MFVPGSPLPGAAPGLGDAAFRIDTLRHELFVAPGLIVEHHIHVLPAGRASR